MKYSKKQIIDSLVVIQNECLQHNNCNQCPFYNTSAEECMFVFATPDEWIIKDPVDEKWCAFQ